MTQCILLQLDTRENREATLSAIENALATNPHTLLLDCRNGKRHDVFYDFIEDVSDLLDKYSEWQLANTETEGYIGFLRLTDASRQQYIC